MWNKAEIKENIRRLEYTISMTGTWQVDYLTNLKNRLASYKEML